MDPGSIVIVTRLLIFPGHLHLSCRGSGALIHPYELQALFLSFFALLSSGPAYTVL